MEGRNSCKTLTPVSGANIPLPAARALAPSFASPTGVGIGTGHPAVMPQAAQQGQEAWNQAGTSETLPVYSP